MPQLIVPPAARRKAAATLAGLLTALCAVSAAQAADPAQKPSFYVGVDANLSASQDMDFRQSKKGKVNLDPGVSLPDLKFGYRPQALRSGAGDLRVEAELVNRAMGVDHAVVDGVRRNGKGDLGVGAAMANVFFDINTSTALRPYVGAGVGVAATGFTKDPGLGLTKKDSVDAALAGQVSVGLSYTPDALPATEWTIGYNYLAVGDQRFRTNAGDIKADVPGVSAVQLGMRYNF